MFKNSSIFYIVINFFDRKAKDLLFLWISLLSILYSLLSILRHNRFESGGFDLGIFDQAVWQYANFIYPYNTIKERFILGDHLTLTLPLLAPLFYLWNDVKILLVFQAVWISFSALAVYKLTKLRNFPQIVSLTVSVVYSMFFGFQYAIFSDFHPIIIGVGFMPWLVYFLESKKIKLFIFAFILAICTQENMGFAITSIGLIYIFRKEYRRIALFFIFFGIIESLTAMRITGLLSPFGYEYAPHISWNPLQIAVSYFDSDEKRQSWLYSLSSFSFLPLFSPGALLAAFFDLAQYFILGNQFPRMWTPFQHYRAILGVFFMLGTLDALAFFKERKLNPLFISAFLLIGFLFSQNYFHFALNKLKIPQYWKYESWMNDNNKLFTYVPQKASVAAAQNLVPHLSHRKEIYLIWPRKHKVNNVLCREKECWWLDFSGKPEYLVVDLHPNQWITQLLENNANFEEAVSNMERSGKISLERAVNFAKLYKINY